LKDLTKVIEVEIDEVDLPDYIRDEINDQTEGLLDQFCKDNNCTKDDVWESVSIEVNYNIHKRIIISVKE
jgi:hypothetical protein